MQKFLSNLYIQLTHDIPKTRSEFNQNQNFKKY